MASKKRSAIPPTLVRLESAALALNERGGGCIFDLQGYVKDLRLGSKLEEAIAAHAEYLKEKRHA